MKKETVKYKEIPKGFCFTFEDAVLVYYEDTQRGDSRRSFHAYKDGELYKTSINLQNENEDFYLCDKYGHYIPLTIVQDNIKLRARVKELERKAGFKCTLPTRSGG